MVSQKEKAKKVKSEFERLINADLHSFPHKGKVKVTSKKGVYIISNKSGKVLHVGSTPSAKNGLNQRLNNHMYGSSSFSENYLKKENINIRSACSFRFIELDEDTALRSLLEHYAIGVLCPLHLGTGIKNKAKIA